MRRLINKLTIIGMALALFAVAYLLFGRTTGAFVDGANNQTSLQLLAMVGALLSLVFGFIGRMMDRGTATPVSRVSALGIAVGAIGGLIVLALPYL